MEKELTTQVLIIGAGPTGLMAANQLMRFGIDFIIVDSKSGPTKESRALLVTARSLEIYDQMGLAQTAIERGKRVESINLINSGKHRAEVKIGEIGKGLSDFSYVLAFEQSKNEELLHENLVKHGKQVMWGHEFVELTEYKTEINASAKSNTGGIRIRAQYLIACDGARSPVRHKLNFSFKGGTYQHKFFVADTKLIWDKSYDKLVVSPGNHSFCAFLPLYGDKNYRVLGTLPKEYSTREDITFADLETVIKKTIGVPLEFEKVNWFSTYQLHHRAVSHFSEGRVFLAGDSAHIHSPAGGQGMNTGLQDAYNLCWKMALVLQKKSNVALLDTYNEERLPFAKWLLKFTDRMFSMMTSENWFIRFFRKYIALRTAGLMLSSIRIKRSAFITVSQIGYSLRKSSLSKNFSRQKPGFKAGDRFPYLKDENIYSLLTGSTFHLIHINETPLDTDMREKIKSVFPFEVHIIEIKPTVGWKNLGVHRELFILVRPDNYIAYLSDTFDLASMRSYLKNYFIVSL
ncbi:MAG: FAD-dependent monooxygenase [Flavobacteriales bacterium]